MEVTTKPIIFDGDTGGLTEHFVYTVRSLERMGVSMVIIEDKAGLKKNSLFGTEVKQTPKLKEVIDEAITDTALLSGRDEARAEAWAHIGESASRTVDYLTKKYKEIA